MRQICEIRKEAIAYSQKGIRTISIDEKPGIQAIQAIQRDGVILPIQEGKVERGEYNYIRHGTQCLTANMDVATGNIISPTIAKTRTQKDYVEHMQTLFDSDPNAKGWIIMEDNLNTHMSEGIVREVAKRLGDTQALGIKGKSGILQNKKTRKAYLSDTTHAIRFVFTPKHCSWLNPIECWFSSFSRRVIRRGNFTSIQDLKEKIEKYIIYYTNTLAKPYHWSITDSKAIDTLIGNVLTNVTLLKN